VISQKLISFLSIITTFFKAVKTFPLFFRFFSYFIIDFEHDFAFSRAKAQKKRVAMPHAISFMIFYSRDASSARSTSARFFPAEVIKNCRLTVTITIRMPQAKIAGRYVPKISYTKFIIGLAIAAPAT